MDYEAARRHMVENQIRTNDVSDLRVLAMLESVPREKFLPPELRNQAYVEREISYAPGRRLLTARDFSKLLMAADVRPEDAVLDVACGAGYTTAILSGLAETVVALESEESLVARAQENLLALGVENASVIVGGLAAGAPKQGPFDVIFIGAAIEREPDALLSQLGEGGRLATILRRGGVSRGAIYTKSGGAVSVRAVFDATAASVLSAFEKPKTFVF
jgi:protein-L-isoaspartate(D-aspartate) O-methyltransferase